VTLKDIHVVDLEAFKTGLDRVKDVLTSSRVRIDQEINSLPEAHLARKAVAVDVTLFFRVHNEAFGRSFADREKHLKHRNLEGSEHRSLDAGNLPWS